MIGERVSSRRSAGIVAAAGFVLVSVMVVLALVAADWDATVFVGFGEDATPTREYAEARLGEVRLRPSQGHDGKYFFVQANDPWLIAPADNAEILDLPKYRSQRMLYPALAGGLGLFGPETIVWGLLVVSLLSIGAGTYFTARLSEVLGGSAWWGLAFALNIGLLYSLTSDVSDVLAAALAMGAVLAVYRMRAGAAILALTAAALSREVMIICAVGAAVFLWTSGRRRMASAVLLIPGAFLAGWMLYLQIRLGPDPTSARAVGLPFVGLLEAIPDWIDRPVTLAAGFGVVFLLVVFTVRWWRSRTALGWMFIGFVPLAIVMTDKVWTGIFDYTRALAPALTAAVLMVFVELKADSVVKPFARSG